MGTFNTLVLLCMWASATISVLLALFNILKKMRRTSTGISKKSDEHGRATGAGDESKRDLTELQQLKILVRDIKTSKESKYVEWFTSFLFICSYVLMRQGGILLACLATCLIGAIAFLGFFVF